MNCAIDYVSAPKDYDEFFRIYRPFVVNLCRAHGISDDAKEDVAHEIMLTLYRRDVLAMFDPDFEIEYNGEKRRARFKSFLSRLVLLYLRSHREKQRRIAARELQILDAPMSDHTGRGDGADSSFAEHLGIDASPEGDPVQILINAEQEAGRVAELRAILAAQPCEANLRRLFDRMADHVHERGYVDIPALMEEFRVSSTSMHTWLWKVHDLLQAHLDVGRRVKRPRTVRA